MVRYELDTGTRQHFGQFGMPAENPPGFGVTPYRTHPFRYIQNASDRKVLGVATQLRWLMVELSVGGKWLALVPNHLPRLVCCTAAVVPLYCGGMRQPILPALWRHPHLYHAG